MLAAPTVADVGQHTPKQNLHRGIAQFVQIDVRTYKRVHNRDSCAVDSSIGLDRAYCCAYCLSYLQTFELQVRKYYFRPLDPHSAPRMPT